MTRIHTILKLPFLLIGFWLLAGPALAGNDWITYTHPSSLFSLSYPPDLAALGGRPEEETMPSQEFEWRFPGGEEGAQSFVFLGFYDWPEGETFEQWLAAMGPGTVEAAVIGPEADIPAIVRVALDSWAYQRDVFVPAEDDGLVIAISLVIQLGAYANPPTLAEVEADHADDIAAFDQMAQSFTFNPESAGVLTPPPDRSLDPGPRAASLPGATLENLPELIAALERLQAEARDRPGSWAPGNIALGAPEREYFPGEAELLAMEAGRRIDAVAMAQGLDAVAARLRAAGIDRKAVSYAAFSTYDVVVQGSGLFTYVDGPQTVCVPLRPGLQGNPCDGL